MSLRRTDLIKNLQDLRPEIQQKFGIEIFGITGSWARDEASHDSDIDIVFHKIAGRSISLIHLGGAWNMLNEEFGLDIDLIDWDAVTPRYKTEMAKDLVRFYG